MWYINPVRVNFAVHLSDALTVAHPEGHHPVRSLLKINLKALFNWSNMSNS